MYYNHCAFEVAISDEFDSHSREFHFEPQFMLLKDVLKGNVCDGKYCVWPVKKVQ